MPMQIRPIRSVAILATITIVAIALATTSLLLNMRARELQHAQQESTSLTHMLMEQTEKSFASTDQVLQGVQERLAAPFGRQLGLGNKMVQLLLNARASGLKGLSALFLVDAKGNLVNSSDASGAPARSLAGQPYFKVFAEGHPDVAYLDNPVHNPADGSWTLHMARRLSAQDGSFLGVVVAAIRIAELENALSDVQPQALRRMGIYLSDGTLVASQPQRPATAATPVQDLAQQDLPTAPLQIRTLERSQAAGGAQKLYVGRLAGYPLLVAVTEVQDHSLAAWRETAIPVALGAMLVCIFTALVSAYLISKLQRKEALTAALISANDRYQHTVDSVMDAIVAVDARMTILLFNPAAELMFGRRAADTLGQPLDVLIPAHLRAVHVRHMDQFTGPDHRVPRTVVPQRDIVGLRSDGSVFPIESTFSRSVVDGQLQLTAVLRDATEKRRAEQELREANRQLRELSNSLTQVREQERTRISRELHDDLGQQLTGLKLSLSWLGNRIKEGRETAAQNVDDMRYQLDAAIASVRRIAAELRPRVLDDLDFSEALTWQTREFTRHSGLEVTLNLEAGGLVQDNEVATALFRIVQEALTNVVRHAQARQLQIGLVEQDGRVVLTIHDDGIGFESDQRMAGVGLVGMRERCTAIGGIFSIQSRSGAGTTLSVTVPRASLLVKEA